MATISGVGCAVLDYLWTNVDYSSESFKKHVSKTPGDGGLSPGKLCFVEDWEKFSGTTIKEIQKDQGWAGAPTTENLGGPCGVAMIQAAQLGQTCNVKAKLYGSKCDDSTGDKIITLLKKTPLDLSGYKPRKGVSPYCVCLSDPKANDGHGERSFAFQVGALGEYGPEILDDEFFNSDIVFFGATALCPKIHESLTELLKRGRANGCYNVVATVFDHINESRFPNGRWPMGSSDESFALMDLLMVDEEESRRISGEKTMDAAAQFFIKMGVKAFTITAGMEDGIAWSDGSVFKKLPITKFPVCAAVVNDLKKNPSLRGDTTGCGDNFAGGMLFYMGKAIAAGKKRGELDLMAAVSWGVASGGVAVFSIGGTFFESYPGEKFKKVNHYRQAYKHQIGIKSNL